MSFRRTLHLFIFATLVGSVLLSSPSVFAADCGDVKTSIISCEGGQNPIWSILLITINILTGLIGLAAIGGLVYAAILYTSAGDTSSQVTKAKEMIANVVIGLVLFALMWGGVQYLIPGGVFNRDMSTPAVQSNRESAPNSPEEENNRDQPERVTTITHLHSSGRFDRSVGQWKRDLQALNRQYEPSIITLTEAGQGRSEAVNWNGWNHTKNESIVAWDTAVWKKVASKTTELASNVTTYRNVHINLVVLKHRKSQVKWLWVSAHLPASVDGNRGNFRLIDLFTRAQVSKWKTAMDELPSVVSQFRNQHNVKRRNSVITADWNINLAQAEWRQVMKRYMSNYSASNPTGSRGTLGNRTIDTSFTAGDLTVKNWRALGTIQSSDHKPFVAKYKIQN